VVEIGQTWRSWIAATPGRASRNALIAARSVPFGAAAIDMSMEPRSRLVVLQRMVAQMTRLVTGSSQSQPVQMISAAETTTPSETAASAAMCR